MSAVTGIGSVPFRRLDACISYSLAHDLPFLPQCLALAPHEAMLAQALSTPFESVALEAWLLAAATHRSAWLKVQIAGPSTVRRFGTPALDEAERLRRVHENALTLVARVHRAGRRALIVLDEPNLDADDLPALVALCDALQSTGARLGVHNCGLWSPAVAKGVLESCVSWVSFDADLSLPELLDASALPQFLSRGGEVCLGFTCRESTTMESLRARIPPQLPRERVRLSTSCGLGLSTETEAMRCLELLQSV